MKFILKIISWERRIEFYKSQSEFNQIFNQLGNFTIKFTFFFFISQSINVYIYIYITIHLLVLFIFISFSIYLNYLLNFFFCKREKDTTFAAKSFASRNISFITLKKKKKGKIYKPTYHVKDPETWLCLGVQYHWSLTRLWYPRNVFSCQSGRL